MLDHGGLVELCFNDLRQACHILDRGGAQTINWLPADAGAVTQWTCLERDYYL